KIVEVPERARNRVWLMMITEHVDQQQSAARAEQLGKIAKRQCRIEYVVKRAAVHDEVSDRLPHESPHFQTAPKVSAKTGSSASIVVNRSTSGSSRNAGMVGMSS